MRATQPHSYRWLIRRDMDQVLAIERACYEDPWTEEDFLRTFAMRHVISQVAEAGDEVLGYCVYELRKRSFFLLSMAVAPRRRWQRVGAGFLDRLKGKLYEVRRRSVVALVRESNLGAQLFLRANGFRAVRVLRGYYDNGEDAYHMAFAPFDDHPLARIRTHQ